MTNGVAIPVATPSVRASAEYVALAAAVDEQLNDIRALLWNNTETGTGVLQAAAIAQWPSLLLVPSVAGKTKAT